jgi:hypothetical protein
MTYVRKVSKLLLPRNCCLPFPSVHDKEADLKLVFLSMKPGFPDVER